MSSAVVAAAWIVVGLGLSLGLGEAVLRPGAQWLRSEVREGVRDRLGEPDAEDPFYPPIFDPGVFGLTERLFFTIGFAAFPEVTFITAGGWVILKLRNNWMDREPTPWVRGYRMRALILDAGSMTFALIGGLIIHYGIGL